MRFVPALFGVLPLLCGSLALAGNVLVPSDTKTPDLNLGVAPAKTATLKATASPTVQATEAPVAAQPVNQTPVDETLLQQAMSRTGSTTMSQQAQLQAAKFQDEAFVRTAKKGPPQFFEEMNEDNYADNAPGNARLTVVTAPAYALGINELMTVKHSLGYDEKQVQANCRLRLTVAIMATDATGAFRLMAGQQRTVAYNRPASSVLIQPFLLCNPPATLPQYSQRLFRSGNLLGVQLMSSGSCPPPPNVTSILSVQYKGESKVDCAY